MSSPERTILQLGLWQSIECRYVPVASMYTRSAPRESDLGNLDRRSCVLCSLSTVSSCPDDEIVGDSLSLSIGFARRRCETTTTATARENPRLRKLWMKELTNKLCCGLPCIPLLQDLEREPRFHNDPCNETTTRWYQVDKPTIN